MSSENNYSVSIDISSKNPSSRISFTIQGESDVKNFQDKINRILNAVCYLNSDIPKLEKDGILKECGTPETKSELQLQSVIATGDKKEEKSKCKHFSCSRNIFSASRLGCEKCVLQKLKEIKDINKKFHETWTPLHFALFNGNFDIAKILIDNGANINEKTGKEYTAFHFASSKGKIEEDCKIEFFEENPGIHLDIIRFLIKNGADYTIKNKHGQDGLHFLTKDERKSILKEFGFEEQNNCICDDYDLLKDLDHAAVSGCEQCITNFLENGGDVNINSNRRGLLHTASMICNNECLGVVKILIKYGADVNVKSDEGFTPLHYASCNRLIMKELLKSGADYTIKDNQGRDGLHFLTSKEKTEILKECGIPDTKPETKSESWLQSLTVNGDKKEESSLEKVSLEKPVLKYGTVQNGVYIVRSDFIVRSFEMFVGEIEQGISMVVCNNQPVREWHGISKLPKSVTVLNVSGCDFENLEGELAFTNIQDLIINSCLLTSLKGIQKTKIVNLACDNNDCEDELYATSLARFLSHKEKVKAIKKIYREQEEREIADSVKTSESR